MCLPGRLTLLTAGTGRGPLGPRVATAERLEDRSWSSGRSAGEDSLPARGSSPKGPYNRLTERRAGRDRGRCSTTLRKVRLEAEAKPPAPWTVCPPCPGSGASCFLPQISRLMRAKGRKGLKCRVEICSQRAAWLSAGTRIAAGGGRTSMCHERWASRRDELVETSWLRDLRARRTRASATPPTHSAVRPTGRRRPAGRPRRRARRRRRALARQLLEDRLGGFLEVRAQGDGSVALEVRGRGARGPWPCARTSRPAGAAR